MKRLGWVLALVGFTAASAWAGADQPWNEIDDAGSIGRVFALIGLAVGLYVVVNAFGKVLAVTVTIGGALFAAMGASTERPVGEFLLPLGIILLIVGIVWFIRAGD